MFQKNETHVLSVCDRDDVTPSPDVATRASDYRGNDAQVGSNGAKEQHNCKVVPSSLAPGSAGTVRGQKEHIKSGPSKAVWQAAGARQEKAAVRQPKSLGKSPVSKSGKAKSTGDGWTQVGKHGKPANDTSGKVSYAAKVGNTEKAQNGRKTPSHDVHGPVLGVSQQNSKDPLAHLRAPQRRPYRAVDLFFKGFKRQPLSKVRAGLSKTVPARHILKVSFVGKFLRVTVWKENVNTTVETLRKSRFSRVMVNPADPTLLGNSVHDTRTNQEKVVVCKSLHSRHCKELDLIMRYRVCKREKQSNEAQNDALKRLKAFYTAEDERKAKPAVAVSAADKNTGGSTLGRKSSLEELIAANKGKGASWADEDEDCLSNSTMDDLVEEANELELDNMDIQFDHSLEDHDDNNAKCVKIIDDLQDVGKTTECNTGNAHPANV